VGEREDSSIWNISLVVYLDAGMVPSFAVSTYIRLPAEIAPSEEADDDREPEVRQGG
jgi:hypothetical protein